MKLATQLAQALAHHLGVQLRGQGKGLGRGARQNQQCRNQHDQQDGRSGQAGRHPHVSRRARDEPLVQRAKDHGQHQRQEHGQQEAGHDHERQYPDQDGNGQQYHERDNARHSRASLHHLGGLSSRIVQKQHARHRLPPAAARAKPAPRPFAFRRAAQEFSGASMSTDHGRAKKYLIAALQDRAGRGRLVGNATDDSHGPCRPRRTPLERRVATAGLADRLGRDLSGGAVAAGPLLAPAVETLWPAAPKLRPRPRLVYRQPGQVRAGQGSGHCPAHACSRRDGVGIAISTATIFYETLTSMAVAAFVAGAILLVMMHDRWELAVLSAGLMLGSGPDRAVDLQTIGATGGHRAPGARRHQ